MRKLEQFLMTIHCKWDDMTNLYTIHVITLHPRYKWVYIVTDIMVATATTHAAILLACKLI